MLLARLVDLFWLIAPEFHRDGIVGQLARRRAAAVARRDLARLLRLAAARPRDPAGPRPAVRRSARPDHRARRRAAEDGALAMADTRTATTAEHDDDRRRITRTSDVNIRAIFGFARRADRRRGGRARASSGAVPVVRRRATAPARRAEYPLAAGAGRPRCRRSRGCRPTPREDLRRSARERGRRARRATAGSTRTPASSAFRSTRR